MTIIIVLLANNIGATAALCQHHGRLPPHPNAPAPHCVPTMPSDDEVEVVVSWDVPLKQSPIYASALEIFSGKAHEAPPINKKRTMLLNIANHPSEEYFLHGSQEAKDFELLKKQCFANWTSVSARAWVWTVPYTAEKLALLLVLRDQVDSTKKVRVSPHAGATPQMTRHHRVQLVRRVVQEPLVRGSNPSSARVQWVEGC
jgi:hypothetical protein